MHWLSYIAGLFLEKQIICVVPLILVFAHLKEIPLYIFPDDSYYLNIDSYQYKKLCSTIKDDEQIYRFSDYGIQASKEGICFTLKANMGTWRDRVPFIKDNYGIRRITPYECLALQGFPKDYHFPKIPMTSAYKQCGNSVVVPIIKRIAESIMSVYRYNNYC